VPIGRTARAVDAGGETVVAAVATVSAAANVLQNAVQIVLRENVVEAAVRGPMIVAEDVIRYRRVICPRLATC
jgi:hypothetical protein